MSKRKNKTYFQQDPPPCMIFVDKDGTWFHKGSPIIRREFIRLFYKSLYMDKKGRYIIKFQDQVCRLDVEDTPFIVLRTDLVRAIKYGQRDGYVIQLIDGTEENLDPETLTIGANNVLYCRIRGQRFRARFSRPSYYQLAQHIQEEPEAGRYFLFLNGERYYISVGDYKAIEV